MFGELKQRKKTLVALKSAAFQNLSTKWPILPNETSKQIQKFLSPMFTNINVERSKFLHVLHILYYDFTRSGDVFGDMGTPMTLPTLSHFQNIFVPNITHYLLERCCSFFRSMFKNCALLRKQI